LKLFYIGNRWQLMRALLGWPFALLGIYFIAALMGSMIPTNSNWRPPNDGIDIFVETNGVHVSIIVPMVAADQDLRDLIRPEHLTNPSLYGTHAMIGWGHAGVYQNAATWADVRSGDVASAIFGSDDVLLHVYHLKNPRPETGRKMFRVSIAQYKILIKNIRKQFRLTVAGQSQSITGYSVDNRFYVAHGHYSALKTCNEWTALMLRKAGVRVGIWSPMPGGVMRWF
jgi:uncharacterized protein (TIGR02117 family)